jgi:hypothetical protein
MRLARQAAAWGFCARHALPEEVIAPLAEHLAANLERVPGAGEEARPNPNPALAALERWASGRSRAGPGRPV